MMLEKKILVLTLILVLITGAGIAVVQPHGNGHSESFTIIHTNDTHCFFEEQGSAGFTTVAALKQQYSQTGTAFIVDAGDFLQGNSYGTMTEGRGSVDIMNTIGYDLCVPGNHEFDYGLDIFLERIEQLDFPIICSNLVYSDTGKSVLDEYLVLERNGIRVGFFGLLTPETPVTTMAGNMGNTEVTDPVDAAERMVSLLKKEDVDSIVAVGHLGVARKGYITSDQLCSKVPGIDIFIDGHSHTEMEDGKVRDGSITLEESGTVIASTGCYLKNIGIITSGPGGISAKLYNQPTLSYDITEQEITKVKTAVDESLKEVIGHTEILLNGERSEIRNAETNLGDFIADVMRTTTDSDIALINSGSIRTSLQAGDISLKNLYDVVPFLNYTCTMDVPGSVIVEEMEFSLNLMGATKGGFLQFSGMTVTYDINAEPGSRVVSITVGGEELDPDATYRLATTDFVITGGDGNVYLQDYPNQIQSGVDSMLIDYISDVGTITGSMITGDRLVPVAAP